MTSATARKAETFDPSAKTRVFLMDDPEMTKAYIKFCKAHHRQLNKCRREVIAETGHEAALYDAYTHSYLAGISLRPHGWSWEAEKKKRDEAEGTSSTYFSPPPSPIPAGWRKRVKDDYLSPPLKGGGPEAAAARALCDKWARIEGPRAYLQRAHGVRPRGFTGISMITIGIDVLDDKTDTPKVYVIAGGPNFKVEDMMGFREVKQSAYLAAKGE